MNRRKLFSFLAASPLAAVGAIAKAKEPSEISVDRINLGDKYEIASNGNEMRIGLRGDSSNDVHIRLWDPKSHA